MNNKPLGKTGMSVSEIGFGGEHLEGKDAQLVDQVIIQALDKSATWRLFNCAHVILGENHGEI